MRRYAAVSLLIAFSVRTADAVPIDYEFSAAISDIAISTTDPVPASLSAALLSLVGQSIIGTFTYDNATPAAFSGPFGSFYFGAITNLAASVAGNSVTMSSGNTTVSSSGQDRLSLSGPAPQGTISGTVLGYDVATFGFAWIEGVPQGAPTPSFLANDMLPAVLPAFPVQINVGLFIPGLTPIDPRIPFNASVDTLQGTVRPISVPEPMTLSLLVAGLLGTVGLQRRRQARGTAG